MINIFAIASTITVLMLVLIIRNNLVYQFMIRYLETCVPGNADFWERFSRRGNYNAMLFDLRKWTYKQFYPEG